MERMPGGSPLQHATVWTCVYERMPLGTLLGSELGCSKAGLQLAGMVFRRQWSFFPQHSQSMGEVECRGSVKGLSHGELLMT